MSGCKVRGRGGSLYAAYREHGVLGMSSEPHFRYRRIATNCVSLSGEKRFRVDIGYLAFSKCNEVRSVCMAVLMLGGLLVSYSVLPRIPTLRGI